MSFNPGGRSRGEEGATWLLLLRSGGKGGTGIAGRGLWRSTVVRSPWEVGISLRLSRVGLSGGSAWTDNGCITCR